MADQQLVRTTAKLWFGADPEIFLSQDGMIVGSERALPEEGVGVSPWRPEHVPEHMLKADPIGVIRDGIQVEFNLPPTDCREWMNLEIRYAFSCLSDHLTKMERTGQKFEASFKQVVDVSKKELKTLSKMSRTLGCAPSFNWYTPEITVEKRLKAAGYTADTYPVRSAGGHIHLGLPEHLMSHRDKLAPLMDVLLGNTAVMIDRDPRMAERRTIYGAAGEFRLPRHGFEYRTLSNFWLKSKELVSLVLGLSRLAVYVLDTSVDGPTGPSTFKADQALIDLIDLRAIKTAIDNNDLKLARANFNGVKTFLLNHVPFALKRGTECGLDGAKLEKFDVFLNKIETHGLDAWFPGNIIDNWSHSNFLLGWETFLEQQVIPEHSNLGYSNGAFQ